MIGRIIVAAFQIHFMALAVDVIDRRGPSNKMDHHLQQKTTILAVYIAAKDIISTFQY